MPSPTDPFRPTDDAARADARALIAALLHEGRVSDPNERAYLLQRLQELDPPPAPSEVDGSS